MERGKRFGRLMSLSNGDGINICCGQGITDNLIFFYRLELHNFQDLLPDSHDVTKAAEDISKVMESVGLVVRKCEMKKRNWVLPSRSDLEGRQISLN